MHSHIHSPHSPAHTDGRLIRWATFYDFTVTLMTLGQASRLRRLTVDLAQLQPSEQVLDVGCGTGAVTLPSKVRVGKDGIVAGIDPSPEMIAFARRKAQRAHLEIDFRVGVIEALPFPDASFDVVTSSLMMHHLPRHVQVHGLVEIRRVLKPGGRVLIADMRRPDTPFKRFLTAVMFHRGLRFGVEDIAELLAQAGFEQIEQPKEHVLTVGFVRATSR